jgi:hypothetical protein
LGLGTQFVQADVSGIQPNEKSNVSKALSAEAPKLTSLGEATAKKVAHVNISSLKSPKFNISAVEKEQVIST